MEQNVDCLARIHAQWWQNHLLTKDIGLNSTNILAEDFLEFISRSSRDFFKMYEGFISQTSLALYKNLVSYFLRTYESHELGPLTITHNDTQNCNFLNSFDHLSNETKLIDWEGWSVGIGASDLAYMIAVILPRDIRDNLEKHLLDIYFEKIIANGVEGYKRDDLFNDYRRGVVNHMILLISASAEYYDWDLLQNITIAFEDLRCFELLA
jgi:thiamine kinase-like enzyme